MSNLVVRTYYKYSHEQGINKVGGVFWLLLVLLVVLVMAGCGHNPPPLLISPPTQAPFQSVLPARQAPPIILHPAPTVTPGGTGVSFRQDILPIFQAHCIACHGGIAALHLTEYDYVLAGGINGSGVVPYDPAASSIMVALETGFMPAGAPPLPEAQIDLIRRWIEAGAPNN